MAWISCFVIILVFVLMVRKKEPLGIVPLALFFVLGHALISNLVLPSIPDNDISRVCNKKGLWIEGRISSIPERFGRRQRFDLEVKRAGTSRNNAEDFSGKLRLSIYDSSDELKFNDFIGCRADLKPIENFNNPGGFDYRGYMELKGLRCTGWARDDFLVRFKEFSDPGAVAFLINRMQNYRREFAFHIASRVKNRDAAGVLMALVLGDKSFIDKDLNNVFMRTGASHILAISGLHLSIVALVSFFCFNWFFSLFSRLVIPGHSRKIAALFTLAPLIFYALLSGFSPSTRRALAMVVVLMAAHVMEKEADTFNSLAAAFIVILLVDPVALFSISFQLSFFAVLFIICGVSMKKRVKKPPRERSSLLQKILISVSISLFATLGTQPLIMLYFNQISFAGPFTNLILIPCAGFMAVPLGLSALFIYPVSIFISDFLLTMAGLILEQCIWFLTWVSSMPFLWGHTVTPDLLEILCYYLFFAALFIIARKMKKSGAVIVAATLLVFCAREAVIIHQRFFNKKLSVFVLDVGQGQAVLIGAPLGKRVLVDGGGFSRFSNFDTGESIVAPFLRRQRILNLDAVILTHPESDHMNGLIHIMETFRVGLFIKNRDRGSENYEELMAVVKGKNIKVETLPGLDFLELGGVRLEFLHPLGRTPGDLNNNSIVSKLIHGKISILLPGDIMKNGELQLVQERGNRLLSNVLIAPHHGSSSSSSDFFLDKVFPESVIISCGKRNMYGFPHATVIERYLKRGYRLFRTDISGAVQILSTGRDYQVLPFKGD